MAASAVEECTVDHVVRALNQRKSAGPTSLNQIRLALPKPLQKSRESLARALAEALRDKLVWQYGNSGGSEQFWTQAPAEFASGEAENKLRQKAGGVTEAELVKLLSSALLKGLINPGELIKSLVSQGRIFVQPKINNRQKGGKYTLEPLEFVDQLVAELIGKVNTIARVAGLDEASAMERARSVILRETATRHSASQLTALVLPDTHQPISDAPPHVPVISPKRSDELARSDAEIGELMLQAMREIEPRFDDGHWVMIPELRQRLDFHQIEKSRFDRILMSLYVARRVVLSKTSAGLLSEGERQVLAIDEEGDFYNTVSLWKD